MITSLFDEYWPESLVWFIYFILILATKTFVKLGDLRFQTLSLQGVLDSTTLIRHLTCLIIVFVVQLFLLWVPIYLFFAKVGWHPLLLFILDGVQALLSCLTVILNYTVYLKYLDRSDEWPTRDSFNHGILLVGTCLVELLNIVHLSYIWSYIFLAITFLDLVLMRYLLSATFKLISTVRSHRDYFNVIHDINNKYRDASEEECKEAQCAICRDEIRTGKILPCSHIFHLKCLQDWMRYRQICPICRKNLATRTDGNENSESNTDNNNNANN
eukprot:UN24300